MNKKTISSLPELSEPAVSAGCPVGMVAHKEARPAFRAELVFSLNLVS